MTPSDRHAGRHRNVLKRRRAVYEAAREHNPERWRADIRNLDPIDTVVLNPEPES